jgi:hypothetical protein
MFLFHITVQLMSYRNEAIKVNSTNLPLLAQTQHC